MTRRPALMRRQRGLSLAEVLAAIVLIVLTVVPAGDALRIALRTVDSNEAQTVNHYRLRGKLEEVLAQRFELLAAGAAGAGTPSAYSDTAGGAERRLVFIAPYDVDNADGDNDPFTGTEPDVLWIEVRIEGRVDALQTLKNQL